VSTNIDERFLDRWHDSQRRQKAMRDHLAQSRVEVDGFEARTLNLIADAFATPPPSQVMRSSLASTSAFMSDDR
jgi:hypothetical protein